MHPFYIYHFIIFCYRISAVIKVVEVFFPVLRSYSDGRNILDDRFFTIFLTYSLLFPSFHIGCAPYLYNLISKLWSSCFSLKNKETTYLKNCTAGSYSWRQYIADSIWKIIFEDLFVCPYLMIFRNVFLFFIFHWLNTR